MEQAHEWTEGVASGWRGPGRWRLRSASSPAWNCEGEGMVGGRPRAGAAVQWIEAARPILGAEPPDDLRYECVLRPQAPAPELEVVELVVHPDDEVINMQIGEIPKQTDDDTEGGFTAPPRPQDASMPPPSIPAPPAEGEPWTKRRLLSDPNSCLNRASDDELVFLLVGKDESSPCAVRVWANSAELQGCGAAKVQEARAIADAMEARPNRKAPD